MKQEELLREGIIDETCTNNPTKRRCYAQEAPVENCNQTSYEEEELTTNDLFLTLMVLNHKIQLQMISDNDNNE